MEGGRVVIIGMGLILAGYAAGIWGYCLVRGYDVPFTGIWGATWPGGGKKQPAGAVTPPVDPGTGIYAA